MNWPSEKHLGTPTLHLSAGPKSGPVLLFLHGLGRFSEDYLPFATALSRNWQIVALDFRGHGNSDWASGQYFVTNYLEDVVRLLQARFADPIVIYGHSLGAMVALGAAARLPGQVRGIILEDPPFHTMGRRIQETPWAALFIGMQQVSRRGGTPDQMAKALGDIAVPSREGAITCLRDLRSAQAIQFGARCLAKVDPSIFTAPIEGRWLDGYDEREFFKQVRCPALLLQGDPEAGAALTDEDAVWAETSMAQCRRVRFSNTGHLVRQERPAEVLQAVEAFGATLPPLPPVSRQIFLNQAAEAACLEEQLRNQPNQSNRPYV